MTGKTEQWTIILQSREMRYLASLPRAERERILAALERLESDPYAGDMKPMAVRSDWRLRVGRWRVLIRKDEEQRNLAVVGIGPRGDVYK